MSEQSKDAYIKEMQALIKDMQVKHDEKLQLAYQHIKILEDQLDCRSNRMYDL